MLLLLAEADVIDPVGASSASAVWQAILAATALHTILLAAIGWIVKVIVNQRLARDLERYSQELSHRLELAKVEHEVAFRRVDDKVAKTVVGAYRRMYKLYSLVEKYANSVTDASEADKKEMLASVDAANKECNSYIFLNRPYIPPTLFKTTTVILNEFQSAANSVTRQLRHEAHLAKMRNPPPETGPYKDAMLEAHARLNGEVSELFSAFVRDVQLRLAVSDLPTSQEIMRQPGS